MLPGSEPTWRHEVRHGYSRDELAGELTAPGIEVRAIHTTSHALVRLAQEARDLTKDRRARLELLTLPLAPAAVWLERHGVRLGRGRALFAQAVRR